VKHKQGKKQKWIQEKFEFHEQERPRTNANHGEFHSTQHFQILKSTKG
jgi:hypothetical protein